MFGSDRSTSSGERVKESITAAARFGAWRHQRSSIARPCSPRALSQLSGSPLSRYGSFSHMNPVCRSGGAWLGSKRVGQYPAGLMMTNHLNELVDVIETHHHHECLIQLGPFCGDGVMRCLA